MFNISQPQRLSTVLRNQGLGRGTLSLIALRRLTHHLLFFFCVCVWSLLLLQAPHCRHLTISPLCLHSDFLLCSLSVSGTSPIALFAHCNGPTLSSLWRLFPHKITFWLLRFRILHSYNSKQYQVKLMTTFTNYILICNELKLILSNVFFPPTSLPLV